MPNTSASKSILKTFTEKNLRGLKRFQCMAVILEREGVVGRHKATNERFRSVAPELL